MCLLNCILHSGQTKSFVSLSGLAGMSETLRCQSNSISQPPSTPIYQLTDIEFELEEKNSSHDIATPERIQDLLQVQNKIDALNISSVFDA